MTITIGSLLIGSVYTVDCEEPIEVAEKIMRQRQVRHLPVLDGKKIYGIISDRDIKVAKTIKCQQGGGRPILVREMCSCDPYIVAPTELLSVVTTVMAKRRLGCTIVMEKEQLRGIFTTTDACRLLSEYAKKM